MQSKNLLSEKLLEMDPVDVAEIVEKINDSRKHTFLAVLSHKNISQILLSLQKETRRKVLKHMETEQIASLVKEMESDDAADFVAEIPVDTAKEVLSLLPDSFASPIQELMQYPEGTAGSIMQAEFISLNKNRTCRDAIELVRSKTAETDDLHYLYVTNDFFQVIGTLPLRRLINNRSNKKIKDLMKKKLVTVNATANYEEVINIFQKYNIDSLPVVNESNRLIGQILHDDVLEVLAESDTEDILKTAGTHEEELESQSWIKAAKCRLPWLLSSLIGGVIMAGIIRKMGYPIEQAATLAAFIPVINGMSGNVSAQSSAITVRGITLGKLDPRNVFAYVIKEMRVAFALSSISGLVLGLVSFGIGNQQALGLVVGLSLFISMELASFVGIFAPLVLERMSADPVLGAGPIVLTVVDVAAVMIYSSMVYSFL